MLKLPHRLIGPLRAWSPGEFGRDLRFAVRGLRATPLVTIGVVTTLSLAIAAMSLAFGAFAAVMIDSVPGPAAARLVAISRTPISSPTLRLRLGATEVAAYRVGVQTLDVIGSYRLGGLGNLMGEDVPVVHVYPGFFETFGVFPRLGLWTTASLDGSEVVLGHSVWRRFFSGSQDVLSRRILIGNTSYWVRGVMPPSFVFPLAGDQIWVLRRTPTSDITDLLVVGRLANTASPDDATKELAAMHRAVGGRPSLAENTPTTVTVTRLRDQIVGDYARIVWLFALASGLVMAIACVNVVGLLAAHFGGRARDNAIRIALGATSMDLFRAAVAEVALLMGLGGLAGLGLAWWSARSLRALVPVAIPGLMTLTIDWRVIVSVTTICAACAASIAFVAGGTDQAVDSSAVRRGRTASTSRPRGKKGNSIPKLLIIGQAAAVVVLIITTALLIRGAASLLTVDLGFDPRQLTVFSFNLNSTDKPRALASLVVELQRVYGVRSAAVNTIPPFAGVTFGTDIAVERVDGSWVDVPRTAYQNVDTGYFVTMGTQVLGGRAFAKEDLFATPCSVIVNDALSKLAWSGADPIGRKVATEGPSGRHRGEGVCTVVGIVKDVRETGLMIPAEPRIYFPLGHRPEMSYAVLIRSSAAPFQSADIVTERILEKASPRQGRVAVESIEQKTRKSLVTPTVTSAIMSSLSVVAMVFAAIGVYGMSGESAAQRRREIGVRLALGATRRQIIRHLVTAQLTPVVFGILAGEVVAVWVSRTYGAIIPDAGEPNVLILVGVPAIVFAVGAAAALIPAVRASYVDPDSDCFASIKL